MFHIAQCFLMQNSSKFTKSLITKMPHYSVDPRMVFIVLLWLIKKAWVWKSLTIIGFDFFAKQAPFKVGAQILLAGTFLNRVDEIPHNALEEREYALEMSRNGIINWVMLSDLKEEVLEL